MPADKILSDKLDAQLDNESAKETLLQRHHSVHLLPNNEASNPSKPTSTHSRSRSMNPYHYVGGHLNRIIIRCILILCIISLILHLMPHHRLSTAISHKSNGLAILIWNESEDAPDWTPLQCGCLVTANRNYYKGNIDAVVVNVDRPYSLRQLKDIKHTPNYLMVLASTSPLSLAQNPLYDHANSPFNFTMSYRLDSDLVWSSHYFSKLGELNTRVQQFDVPNENFMETWTVQQQYDFRIKLKRKHLLAGYMMYAVNDYSLPESLYLQELRNHIELDAFMGCNQYQDCSHYKFMLIFDPSVCPDFVHPQFYMALANFVVPVLIGGSNLTQLAPPGSYISSQQFNSPKDLAQHLKQVAEEPMLYEQFFWWHSKYRLQQIKQPYCELCHRLQQQPRPHRNPDAFLQWWTQYQCSNSTNRLGWSA
ncbi:alpha-(1,3)-fucosyltransferase C [Drosophila albomicans]|uniref:Fucosyltransferase n=1 Tax=Drosophila albomicans TaxID=7291 RepID=A0A6P8YVE7_DROAB|nr:alpha-(1,3)-fucosyltransferase C [Drosophila albomicans]